MIRKRLVIGGATGAAAAALVAAMVSGVPAASLQLSGSSSSTDDTPQIKAMAEGLGISTTQAKQRLDKQTTNSKKALSLEAKLGAAQSGGAYLDQKTGDLQVNVTNAQAAAQVKAAGATPHLVANSQATLDSVQAKLDAASSKAPASSTWSVDPTTNAVRLTTLPTTSTKAINAFLAKAGVTGSDAAKVSVSKTGRKLRAEAALIGGDDVEIYKNNVGQARCTVGFDAIRKSDNVKLMLTAGHCSLAGNQYARVGTQIGSLLGWTFGSHGDYTIVSVWSPSSWSPFGPYVTKQSVPYSSIKVNGSAVAAVGAYACKSGSTSRWTCGYITQKNVTVDISDDNGHVYTVMGETDSSICSMPGDSGGPIMAGGQAQGMVSAGPSDGPTCNGTQSPSGSETLFQPIAPVLSKFGFKLYTTK